MKRWLSLAAVAALSSIFVVGCAKDAEPTAAPNDTTTTTEPEKPATPGELKQAPEAGDKVVVFDTDKGKIVIMLFPDRAPETVKNFLELAGSGFYNGTRFHRCIADFMVQGGDPKSKDLGMSMMWGTGGNVVDGKEKTLPNEVNDIRHKRGILSMANSGSPETASSQFFIVQKDSAHLDGGYTAFGKVVEGMDVVDAIVKTGDPNDNGKVQPGDAVELKTAKVETWPLAGASAGGTEPAKKDGEAGA